MRHTVGAVDDFVPGEPKLVEIDGMRIVVVRVGEQVYAMSDTCAHHGGPLSEGRLSGTRLACPWHGWMYDVRSGQCVMPSRGAPVPSYPARVEDGHVIIEV